MTLGIMESSTDREDLIQLEPLVHQVGGHSSMFVLDDRTVCKPLIGREYQFYRTLPSEMKRYAPEFRGRLQVVLQEDGNGISLAALPNEQTHSLQNIHGPIKKGSKLRRVSSSSLDYESTSSDEESPTPHANSSSAGATHTACAASATNFSSAHPFAGEPRNPWLEESQQNHLQKLKQKSDSSNVVECIMLENLTYEYRYPSVLDLKMGTRQYGDDAPESKRRSQTAKAAKTTTATLGVRLVGMQVFNKEKKSYICRNKYFGRQLSEESFKHTLKLFLTSDGKRVQLDIADAITTKLKELRSIVAKLDSFRFFTSSLLILYDSSELLLRPISDKEKEYEPSKVRDRGKCRDREGDRENFIPNELKSSKKSRDINSEEVALPRESWLAQETKNLPSSNNNSPSEGILSSKMSYGALSRSDRGPAYKIKGRHKCKGPTVDIRLIDFAHATHKGMKDSTLYKGCDEGLIMGLDSLIKIFQDIRDSCERS